MHKSKITFILLFVFIFISFTSCAPYGYEEANRAGFWAGLWHGFIVIFSLIGKLFGATVGIYAENNTGFTYWLGFIIGLGSMSSGPISSASKKR